MSCPICGIEGGCGQASNEGPFGFDGPISSLPSPPQAPEGASKNVAPSEPPCQNDNRITCCRVQNVVYRNKGVKADNSNRVDWIIPSRET